jgi:hypothetical protein
MLIAPLHQLDTCDDLPIQDLLGLVLAQKVFVQILIAFAEKCGINRRHDHDCRQRGH